MIDSNEITGLVLAGGRGSRMGGIDKGLQTHAGIPLAMHALLRLSPQVGEVMINANRNLGAYESMGVPVWPDCAARLSRSARRLPDRPRALRDALPGHRALRLAALPGRSRRPPGRRLRRRRTELAMAATREDGELRLQPVFCLMRANVLESLVRFTSSGRRKIDAWTARHSHRRRRRSTTPRRSSTPTRRPSLQALQRHV